MSSNDTKLSTQPYKGTRDFYPHDMRLRQWMFHQWRQVLLRFGYEEYDGPMLEPFELYASKTSEEIVSEQLYAFTDRGGRKLAIRPEMTPTLARMIAAKQNELPQPIRWFSIPNLWRYERPQRGRLREHWQLNVDVFGGFEPSSTQILAEEVEICELIVALMSAFGATTQYEVRLNHRGLTDFIFKKLLKLEEKQIVPIGRLLDAAQKMKPEAFHEGLVTNGLNKNQIETLQAIIHGDTSIQKSFSQTQQWDHLNKIITALKELKISDRFTFDFSLMRGFLYYTGTVLEVFDTHPENTRALFGGGRYDNLVGMFGGKALPGFGFGMGDVTFLNFLESHKLLPNLNIPKGIIVAYLTENEWVVAEKLVKELRDKLKSISVMTILKPEKPKKVFNMADKLGARSVIFVGPDEVKSGTFPMKDLVKGTQTQGAVENLAEEYTKWIGAC